MSSIQETKTFQPLLQVSKRITLMVSGKWQDKCDLTRKMIIRRPIRFLSLHIVCNMYQKNSQINSTFMNFWRIYIQLWNFIAIYGHCVIYFLCCCDKISDQKFSEEGFTLANKHSGWQSTVQGRRGDWGGFVHDSTSWWQN